MAKISITTPDMTVALARQLRDLTCHKFTGGMRSALGRWRHKNKRLLVAVAWSRRVPVGWACVHERRSPHVMCLDVYVRKPYRGRGLAISLVKTIVNRCLALCPAVTHVHIRPSTAQGWRVYDRVLGMARVTAAKNDVVKIGPLDNAK